jgi:hypothetical protein
MKVLKVVPLVLGFLLYANSACALTLPGAAAAAAATGAGLEAILQGVEQANSFLAWSRANNLTPEEVKQVQAAIDYMKEKGFVNEARQAQTMLNNTKSTGWSLLGSTYVVREGGSSDMAETFGGPSNAVFNNGHTVLYRNFFNTSKHDGLVIDTPDKRIRDQALTLIHELEHKNTQSDVTDIHLINLLRGYDGEKGPLTKTAETLGPLGYTPDEVRTIRDAWATGPYKKYVNLIDKANPKPDPPKADDATPPTTDEPGPDATRDRPRKHRSDATKSKGPRSIDDEPTKTKEPPLDGSDLGDLSDIPVDPNLRLPHPTPDQIARAGRLGDQSQGGIPGTNQPPGQATGQTGQPQGGYQSGPEVPGTGGPQQPSGPFPPYDPRYDPRGGGMNVPTSGSQYPRGGTASAQNPPARGGTQQPPASGAQCSQPLCYQPGQQGCISGPLPNQKGWEAACYANMLSRCNAGEAGATGATCVHKGADASCAVRARRVCAEMSGNAPVGPACGPATQGKCTCPGGAKGHIPCDKSKGKCHCGAG